MDSLAEIGAVALLLSYIIASLCGILAITFKHKPSQPMPFGTFLAVGMLVTVAGRPLLDWYRTVG
jgi:prepilin signal peptidase PulO-like enzyme (type II secretory pathway)